MSRHILLSGGTGFFGTSILRYIQGSDTEFPPLTIISRNPSRFAAQNPELARLANWIKADVLEIESLPRNQRFTHIIHAAANAHHRSIDNPLNQYRQIVDGTKNMLEYAVHSQATRFLFISSGAAYGPQPTDLARLDENYSGMPEPLIAKNAYGVAKRTAEHLCALYQTTYGIETVVARCFAFVGRDLPLYGNFAIGDFIRDALWRDEITIYGDGSTIRSYLDQSDLAMWLLRILDRGQSNRAYNVGSDQPISIETLANTVRALISPNKGVRILGTSNSNEVVRSRYVPDISRASMELNLSVTVSLEDAITQTAEAHRDARNRHL